MQITHRSKSCDATESVTIGDVKVPRNDPVSIVGIDLTIDELCTLIKGQSIYCHSVVEGVNVATTRIGLLKRN